jgi:hypothetical protein
VFLLDENDSVAAFATGNNKRYKIPEELADN